MLELAQRIADPFERSFFLLVHLPYLQPFADVNKRTARLLANLPLLQRNLQPLSFVAVPREADTLATLAVGEQRRIEPLRDLFHSAYQRSAERYRAIRQFAGVDTMRQEARRVAPLDPRKRLARLARRGRYFEVTENRACVFRGLAAQRPILRAEAFGKSRRERHLPA